MRAARKCKVPAGTGSEAPTSVKLHPDWAELLSDAVSKPGIVSAAYQRFWNYSVGNQLLAMITCMVRGIEPGPIHTFKGWTELGRHVKRGEKAITLCMPVTVNAPKEDPAETGEQEKRAEPGTRKVFVFKPRWFVLSQTEGEPYRPQELPSWSEAQALATLSIGRVPFTYLDGNVQGFARSRSVSVSPIAFAPDRTLFHELAHVVLGHTAEMEMTDDEQTPRNIQEVEAEGTALICCESLGLGGTEYCRGYLQHWLRSEAIPDKSAQRIFKAADVIIRGGRAVESGPDSQRGANG